MPTVASRVAARVVLAGAALLGAAPVAPVAATAVEATAGGWEETMEAAATAAAARVRRL